MNNMPTLLKAGIIFLSIPVHMIFWMFMYEFFTWFLEPGPYDHGHELMVIFGFLTSAGIVGGYICCYWEELNESIDLWWEKLFKRDKGVPSSG